MTTATVIGREKAEKIALGLLDYIETLLDTEIAKEVVDHLMPQLAGLLTNLYVRPADGLLGHMGIEKTILHVKFQEEANKQKKKKA